MFYEMDENVRIARALNHLGENADLFAADSGILLDLIEDYFEGHATDEGKILPIAQPTDFLHPQ